MRNLLRLVLPLLMLQGCAGNPVAQQLERSFDQPAVKAPGPLSKRHGNRIRIETHRYGDRSFASADAQPVDATAQNDALTTPSKADQAGNDKAKGNDAMQNDGVENDGEEKDQEDKSQELNDAGELPPSDLPQEPYRITIRLSAADPASPAEAVTRVLRQAGVPFAVERIERVAP